MKNFFRLLIVVAVIFGIYGVLHAQQPGTNVLGDIYTVPPSSLTFFEDLTFVNDSEERFSDQEIFDEIFAMIDRAQHYILIDMFLFNDFLGNSPDAYRALSSELTDALLVKRNEVPDMDIILITDPINTIYGGYDSIQLKELEEAGIHVIVTDLTKLRDSNPVVSAFWRAYIQWFGNSTDEGYLPNPFDNGGQELGFRTYASLLNFKANHRKVVLADMSTPYGLKLSTLLTSANPHDGSSAHTNIAMRIDDNLWKDVLKSEEAVALLSGEEIAIPDSKLRSLIKDKKGSVEVQLLTEEKIRVKILESINELGKDDSLDMAMFYLSDRKIVSAIKKASDRKVGIRIVLDPNKDAFGREKNGIPNRQVASELKNHDGTIGIRWCHTHGEQCHTKLLLIEQNGIQSLILGSANLTRRNIGGYNLETNVFLRSSEYVPAFNDAHKYFEKVWNNEKGKIYSIEYGAYKDDSFGLQLLYRLMEDIGTSSF